MLMAKIHVYETKPEALLTSVFEKKKLNNRSKPQTN